MNRLGKPQIVAIAAGALALVILAGGYLVLIGPKRSKASDLDGSIASTRTQLTVALAQSHGSSGRAERVQVADLFRLSRAMPDTLDGAGVLLDLNRLAQANKVELRSVTPTATSSTTPPVGGYQPVPVAVELQGRYGAVTRFLSALRGLVSVRGGKLAAAGHLFGVDSVDLSASDGGFPQVKATLGLEAYVFAPAAAAPDTSSTATVPASTSDSDATAAGSEVGG